MRGGKYNSTPRIHYCKALWPTNSLDGLASPGPESVCQLGKLVGIAWGLLLMWKEKHK